jgi:hypothetical protein
MENNNLRNLSNYSASGQDGNIEIQDQPDPLAG